MRPILAIDENEKIPLPKKFHAINDLCAVIYDQLTEIYKLSNYKPLLKTALSSEDSKKFIEDQKENPIHILDWLKEHALDEELEIMLTKHLTLSIVSDLINFIFESMYCAKRGKMTVAYALIRKPFTDELLILEQLLVNREEFVKKFFHIGNPDEYDPSSQKIDKMAIITAAVEKIRTNHLYSAEIIYKSRYDKTFEAGLNGISNQALHIVTRDKSYKTLEQNLNFVFSQKDDFNRYYENYYYIVPQLLIYTVSVIDGIIFNILTDKDNQALKTVKEFRRIIAYLFFTEYSKISPKRRNDKLFDRLSNLLDLTCSKCKYKNKLNRADFKLFLDAELFICSKCFNNLLDSLESVQTIDNLLSKEE
jgi:hypothetical protein